MKNSRNSQALVKDMPRAHLQIVNCKILIVKLQDFMQPLKFRMLSFLLSFFPYYIHSLSLHELGGNDETFHVRLFSSSVKGDRLSAKQRRITSEKD